MGYRFQFITLAGFHSLNHGMFDLARGYAKEGMPAYVKLQEREFEDQERGFTAVKHQREVGTGYFDLLSFSLVLWYLGMNSQAGVGEEGPRELFAGADSVDAAFCGGPAVPPAAWARQSKPSTPY
jgi:hypothetical protein